MQTESGYPMKSVRLLIAAVALLIAAGPGLAADPVFPPGVRVGLTPLPGLVRAKEFSGFETEDQSVKVLVAELPAQAFGEVMNAVNAEPPALRQNRLRLLIQLRETMNQLADFSLLEG